MAPTQGLINIEVNLNTLVRVKLSLAGVEHYYKIHKHLPKFNEDGEYSDQMWSLFQDFGSTLGNGVISPFESTIIIIEKANQSESR